MKLKFIMEKSNSITNVDRTMYYSRRDKNDSHWTSRMRVVQFITQINALRMREVQKGITLNPLFLAKFCKLDLNFLHFNRHPKNSLSLLSHTLGLGG
jgi:hypothetical protein